MKLLLILSVLCGGSVMGDIIPDTFITTAQRIQNDGYPAEEHIVETKDGYLLKMFRIPYSSRLQNQNVANKKVVFLMHGFICSSDDYILSGTNDALAYNLADAGYDIWLGNARGNVYSKNHTTLSPLSPEFWDFEWHQIAIYDLPAMFDHILQLTGQKDMHYVGHSQGTTVFLVLNSMKPEYNSKIKTAHLLAPVGYTSHMRSPFALVLGPILGTPLVLNDLIGQTEFLPNNELLDLLGYELCKLNSPVVEMCSNILFLIGGWDSVYINKTMLSEVFRSHPAGSSTKQGIHYVQEYNTGFFRQYDYGLLGNLFKYGSISPPNYVLENVRSKGGITLYSADNDLLSAPADVERLIPRLGNKAKLLHVKDTKYNHLDFLWAINSKDVINDCVLDKINEYEGFPFTGTKCNNFK